MNKPIRSIRALETQIAELEALKASLEAFEEKSLTEKLELLFQVEDYQYILDVLEDELHPDRAELNGTTIIMNFGSMMVMVSKNGVSVTYNGPYQTKPYAGPSNREKAVKTRLEHNLHRYSGVSGIFLSVVDKANGRSNASKKETQTALNELQNLASAEEGRINADYQQFQAEVDLFLPMYETLKEVFGKVDVLNAGLNSALNKN